MALERLVSLIWKLFRFVYSFAVFSRLRYEKLKNCSNRWMCIIFVPKQRHFFRHFSMFQNRQWKMFNLVYFIDWKQFWPNCISFAFPLRFSEAFNVLSMNSEREKTKDICMCFIFISNALRLFALMHIKRSPELWKKKWMNCKSYPN